MELGTWDGPLVDKLSAEGFRVFAIARQQSVSKVPSTCTPIPGDVLNAITYKERIPAGGVFVHLVGVAHPAPWKGALFQSVDLGSLEQSVAAARHAAAQHFVFVSLAHPAPVMKAYIEVRTKCEEIVRQSGLNATILRPWYILGPGHRWPYVLIPFYKLLEAIPSTRAGAVRLGLVTRGEMVNALAAAVASPPTRLRVLEPAQIRAVGSGAMKL
ncbi:MAG: NAD(P)H-binding protein [Bryobacteraceae bacterium]